MNPVYAVVLIVLVAYWLVRVVSFARKGFILSVGWSAVFGFLFLILADLLYVPALFGIGAACLLLAEYWPFSFKRLAIGQSFSYPIHKTVLLLICILSFVGMIFSYSISDSENVSIAIFIAAFLTFLFSLLIYIQALFYDSRIQFPKKINLPNYFAAQPSAISDFELISYSQEQVLLQCNNKKEIHLLFWSSLHKNEWYTFRHPSSSLDNIQLHLYPNTTGIKIWYSKNGQIMIFRVRFHFHKTDSLSLH